VRKEGFSLISAGDFQAGIWEAKKQLAEIRAARLNSRKILQQFLARFRAQGWLAVGPSALFSTNPAPLATFALATLTR
jgi:hypothetical protein